VLRYFYNSFLAKVVSTGCALLAGILSLKLFSHFLSVQEFGLIVVASQILSYIPYLDGGIRTVSNCRMLAATSEERIKLIEFSQKFYSWFSLIMLGVVTACMLIYWLMPSVRGSGMPLTFFIALGSSFALLLMGNAQGSLLVGLQKQNIQFWIAGASSLINLFALGACFSFGLKLWSFPIASAITFLFSWPFLVSSIKKVAPQFCILDFNLNKSFWEQLGIMRRDAFDSFRSQISILLLFSVDLVIVGAWTSPPEAAVYGLLVRVFGILRSFIQSVGEVSWPLIAQNKTGSREWSHLLLRINAWIYGTITGGVAVFLLPFLKWYMGPEWIASTPLFVLLLVRFVIVGLQSPAGYFLIGLNEFRIYAKWIQLELFAAVVLSVLLLKWGAIGVASGFLAATLCGTFFQIFAAYCQAAGFNPVRVFRSVWLRTLAGFTATAIVGRLILPHFTGILSGR
jgi:O-antigen/teichoic acid export membrane protein